MNQDEKLEKQINEYSALAKENPNVNASMLIINALQNRQANLVPSKGKKWAYLISVGIPFAGFLCFLTYYMRDEDDAKQVALTCAVLSIICLVMTWVFGKLLLSGSGASLDQIRQIKTNDILELTR